MTAPLEGVRVLEVASWLAAPSCAALMADMGASVIKVEPPGGDTYRRTLQGLFGEDFVHPSFQFDNRGKRGVCVNFDSPEGVELVHRLARNADVFITNLTAPRLAKYRLTDSDVHALSPSAIYAVLSGFGTDGPDSQRQAFDQTAFWARTGAMSVFGDRDDGLLISRGGFGDRTTCLNLLAAILAAMRVRDRTGEGQYVEVTLQRTGVWALASDVTSALVPTRSAGTNQQESAGESDLEFLRDPRRTAPRAGDAGRAAVLAEILRDDRQSRMDRRRALSDAGRHGRTRPVDRAGDCRAVRIAGSRLLAQQARRRRADLGTGRAALGSDRRSGAARTRRVLDHRASHRRRDGDHLGAVPHPRRRRRSARSGTGRGAAHARGLCGGRRAARAHRRTDGERA